METASRFRFVLGLLVAFVVWSVVGAALPLRLGPLLILITVVAAVLAGVGTVKLLKPRHEISADGDP